MFTEHVHGRRGKRAATQQKILESAERLFRNQGFGSTTVRQIAADAGVSVGSVMAVGDKDALLIAIFDGWIAAVHRERADHEAAVSATLTPDATTHQVMAVFAPFIEYFARDVALSREYIAVIVRGRHESRVFQALASSLKAEIRAILANSRLSRAHADQGSRVLYFSYLGILMAASSGALGGSEVIEQLQEAIGFVTSRHEDQP